MGLDSVELLFEFENYFEIKIPDIEAEKISTVQDAVNSVSRFRNVSDNNTILKDKIFELIRGSIEKFGLNAKAIQYSDLVSITIPQNNNAVWTFLAEDMRIKIPRPPRKNENSFAAKILTRISWVSSFKYHELTFGELTDAICAVNYEELINNQNINSIYEIYIVITGITVDKIGVDVYDIKPEKTFAGDLGID